MNFNNPDDEAWSSSPASGVDDTSNETLEISEGLGSSGSDEDDVDEGESSVVVMDEDDETTHSVVSARSSSSTASSGRLDAALKQAAAQAGTQGIDRDENGDLSMELADDEVTAAFQPWAKKSASTPDAARKAAVLSGDTSNPFSPAFRAGTAADSPEQSPDGSQRGEEMSMEFTHALGQILSAQAAPSTRPKTQRRKSLSTRKRASMARRRSSGDESSLGDATMDLTMAVGGIDADTDQAGSADSDNQVEEMTMELTAVLGGVIPGVSDGAHEARPPPTTTTAPGSSPQRPRRRESRSNGPDDSDMDMTMAVGGIIPAAGEDADAAGDHSVAMDLTTAFAESLPPQLSTGTRSQAKALMELEAESGELASPAAMPAASDSVAASATGSPSMIKGKGKAAARKSISHASPARRASIPLLLTPVKAPTTPRKQLASTPQRSTVPGKTPPSKNVSMRSASPKKLFKAEIKRGTSTPTATPAKKLFKETGQVGASTPSIILTPRARNATGVGADKEGLGSPKVAALLDRRRSIGDDAKAFTPTGNGEDKLRSLRFEDPQAMERELVRERAEQAEREDSRAILRNEANAPAAEVQKDTTANLKEMIESLTPKKKLKGRKSLAVGAAKGLLGKRPAELDDDSSEERSPKRLQSRDGSPVKSVVLPPPPSKTETTGRVTRATIKSLQETSNNILAATPTASVSPTKAGVAGTPKHVGHFRDVEAPASAVKSDVLFAQRDLPAVAEDNLPAEAGNESEENIHLQDFLNMTSIRFMELTTTKRRQTIVPNSLPEKGKEGDDVDGPGARSLERCVVAGACTIPMLELFQHVSAGRTHRDSER